MTRRSAGLPLSVGQASLPMRLVIALVFAVTAALCLLGGLAVARAGLAARIVAAVLIEPLGLIALIAAAFVLAPHSRFGVWLDGFVARLGDWRIALLTALALIAVSFALQWSAGIAAGRSAGFQPANTTHRQDAGGAAGWKPALLGTPATRPR